MLDHKQVSDLRSRVLSGQPLTLDEQREVIAFVRQDRMTAAQGATKSPKTKKGASEAIPNGQSFLDSLL